MFKNIPNILTLLRILLIPVFVIIFYLPWQHAAQACALVFALAAITDWFDGYLARKLEQVSALGAFLDPVADKLMVAAALILLVQQDPIPGLAIPVLVIIGREITISALREWMAEVGARATIAVSAIGKIKTAFQMTAIFLMIYRDDFFTLPMYTIGFVLLYVAVILTLWSMVMYIKAAWPSLNDQSLVEEEKNG
ncbi:CDP-diacylglycerol--glycerol-3-phosphate 3-phosphatidyltransferase [Sedimenticola selenatireducens]|jgi:CDP-diacylglycerol--glycerol-3-phosphate 3-phosphatidyltransferase/cardiolipin synthase|uniref:CDP-diacylglycerol--glycerol-3-phosphate 3-phosphatidyltransferase n=1 Tax=Sedimenticola selenatireducens TaxID=191960 RepID=A0A558DR48_9GAMM|nr:CDP-diacylglycerol--glycerol-3-phosphate 3-phosphatidyltransferase [Sedimenticola selenatireducens]TVO73477.1 CDP-diacylglycerol--glycerol-3-phosphate 3-phosphatidyltransferase [Sedimenticola selenatireducens]TVT63418.1 MAG: CDP-diacylglycerol--glycerol-3-phosphate 3-phosphatidyltransferase [Sedimenticola selenatireducens]